MRFSKITKIVMLVTLGGLISAKGFTQPCERNLYNFDFIKNSYGWLTSSNASGLSSLPVDHIALLNVSYYQGVGEFVNYHQSSNRFNLTANTESYSKLGEKVTLYGLVSYDFFRGKKMGGSFWSDPYSKSFDIVESTDTTRGDKQKEYYHLIGGVSYNFSPDFSIGGKIDYATGNYAKFKDLRHINYILDLNISAGASYRIADFLNIGLNYLYFKNTESISCSIYGTTGTQYTSIINFGAFYGSAEMFGETGYTSDNYPFQNTSNGGAIQLDLSISPKINFFNEFSLLFNSGYYGIKSSTKIVFSEHSGKSFSYKGLLSFDGDKSKHLVNLDMSYNLTKNGENIYQKTSEGGMVTVTYYGQNPVLSRTVITAGAEYTANLGLNGYTPLWTLKGGANLYYRKQNSSIYPYYRKQNLTSFAGHINGNRNFIKGSSMYGVNVGAEFGTGDGTIKEDGIYTQPSASQKEPKSLDFALYREFEYLTASRVNANVGFRYSRFFKKGVTGYADLNYKFTNAFGLETIPKGTFHSIMLSLGCSF